MTQLRNRYKKESFIRWSQPDNLHVTLQFVAAINPDDLEKLAKNVRAEIHAFPAFDLQIGELEIFPALNNPRIISMKIEPHPILAELAARIGRGIVATGYSIEKRNFRGHVTLARLNQAGKNFLLTDNHSAKIENFLAQEIVLYQSEPSYTGSNYTVLDRLFFSRQD